MKNGKSNAVITKITVEIIELGILLAKVFFP